MRLVLRDARLPSAPESRIDVAIVDGAIRAIVPHGTTVDDAGAEQVDLDGRFVIPGLWDNHVHFNQWAMSTRRLDISEAASASETADLVRNRLARGRPANGEPLVGFGFRDGLWPDAPSRELLDRVSGGHPVILISADLHCCWLNSAALAEHGHPGHPTGLLREEDCFAVTRALDTVADDVLDAWVAEAAQAAAARGVVGVVDLEMTWNRDPWQRRLAAGNRSLRMEFGIYTQHLERAIAEGMRTGDVIDGTDGLLVVGPYKVLTDGSLNTRTAFCHDEYPGLEGQENSRGLHTVLPEQLVALMKRASEAGIEPDVHAIGDHANTLALDAFEVLGIGGRVEHAQLLCESDYSRFAELGVVASVQPEHAMDDRDIAELHWAGRTGRSFALRSLLDAGAELLFGSDAPVAPLDPWLTMAAAVSRSRDGREPWHPEQALSAREALAASTRGQIVPAAGSVADLAVVEQDPLAASVDQLRRMPVAATLLGGRFTHNILG